MIKRPSTKTLLLESFLELTDIMSLSKITVGSITHNCNVRRETFYRYFPDKYELINDIYVEYVQAHSIEQLGRSDIREIILYGLQFFREHPVFFREAFKDNGQNNFRESLSTSIINAMRELIQSHYHLEQLPARVLLSLNCFVYGGVGIVTDWVESGFSMADTLIAEVIVDTAPPVIKELFEAAL